MSSITKLDVDGNVIKKGSKARPVRYRARWRAPDGGSRSQTFPTMRDAEQHLTKVESAKLNGGYVERSAGAETVDAYMRKWIDTRRTKGGQPIRPRTRDLYLQILDSHIKPAIGNVRLRDVSPSLVREWHSKLPGSTTPAKAYRLLRAAMSTAVADEMIARNPCRVDNGGVERAPERPLPTGDQVWAIADAIGDRWRAMVLVSGFVGLRWGELIGLQRGDVDLDGRVIHVERQIVEVDGVFEVGPPKTDAGIRTVAIPPAVVGELRAHLDRHVGEAADSLVFVGPKGATPHRSNFSTVWKRARTKVGREDLHFHDLRHYANTLAASAGASTKELMRRLGHSSSAAALRYQHATEERDQAVAERMSDMIAGRAEAPAVRVLKVVG